MDSPTIFAKLRNILAQLYPDERSARRIVADAGLKEMSIEFSSRAIDNWHAILTEANKSGKTEGLIAIISGEYGNYPELDSAWDSYHALLKQGIDPLIDDRFPGESPYRGMQYFDVQDADLFFGREQLTAELVGYLREQPFLVVIGASGSGKSSLVRAGLIPALNRGQRLADGTLPPPNSERWLVHIITPKAHPLDQLAASLTETSESVTAQATLMDDLATHARSLHLYATRLVNRAGSARLLLVVDQFVELFTLCRDPGERQHFVDNLLTAAIKDGATTVVITLRADFYHRCAETFIRVIEFTKIAECVFVRLMTEEKDSEAWIDPNKVSIGPVM